MIHQVYSIAEEIKRLREERDMTQEELAESAEISLSHLSKVESGSRMIGMKTYLSVSIWGWLMIRRSIMIIFPPALCVCPVPMSVR